MIAASTTCSSNRWFCLEQHEPPEHKSTSRTSKPTHNDERTHSDTSIVITYGEGRKLNRRQRKTAVEPLTPFMKIPRCERRQIRRQIDKHKEQKTVGTRNLPAVDSFSVAKEEIFVMKRTKRCCDPIQPPCPPWFSSAMKTYSNHNVQGISQKVYWPP